MLTAVTPASSTTALLSRARTQEQRRCLPISSAVQTAAGLKVAKSSALRAFAARRLVLKKLKVRRSLLLAKNT